MPLSLEDRKVLEGASLKLMDAFNPIELLPGLVGAGVLKHDDSDLIVNKAKESGNKYGMMELLGYYKRRASQTEGLEPLKSVLSQEGHDVEEYFLKFNLEGLQQPHKQSAPLPAIELRQAVNAVVSQANSVYGMVDRLEGKCIDVEQSVEAILKQQFPKKKADSMCFKCMRNLSSSPEPAKSSRKEEIPPDFGKGSELKGRLVEMKTDVCQLESSADVLVGTNLKSLQEALKAFNSGSSGRRIEEEMMRRDVQDLVDKLVEERKELIKALSLESNERKDALEKLGQRLNDPKLEEEIEWIKGRVDTLEKKLEEEFKTAEEQRKMPAPELYKVENQDIEKGKGKTAEDVLEAMEEQGKQIAELEMQNEKLQKELFRKQSEFEENLNMKAKQMEEQGVKIGELEKENKEQHTELFRKQREFEDKLTDTNNTEAKQMAEQNRKIVKLQENETKNAEVQSELLKKQLEMVREVERKYEQNQREMRLKQQEHELNVSRLNDMIQEVTQNLKTVESSRKDNEKANGTGAITAEYQAKQNIAWLLGGYNFNSYAIAIIEVYNPSGPTIRSLTHLQLKTPRYNHNCVLVHGNLYIIGGIDSSGNPLDSVEVFAPYSNIAIDSSLVLKERRGHAATTTKDGYIFVFGGYVGTPISSSECLNVSHGVFESLAPMPSTRWNYTAECIGDCMYLIGGRIEGGSYSNSVLVYHPATNKYNTNNHNLLETRSHHASAVEESTIVVTGGWDGSKPLSSSERYDPRDGNKSMRLADMNQRRVGHALVNIGGQFVAMGGSQSPYNSSGPFLDSIEVYDSRMDKWTVAETKLLQQRAYFGAVVV